MDISFHRLNQLIASGKITLQYDSVQQLAYYTRKIVDDEDNVTTKNVYLPGAAEIQNTLSKTNDERQGIITVRDFYQAQP